jgi:hypothetical protein
VLRIFRKQKLYKAYVDGKWIPDLRVEARDSSKGTWYEIRPETRDATEVVANLPLTLDSIPEYLPHFRLTRDEGLVAPVWLTSIQASRVEPSFLVTALLTFAPDTPGLVESAGAFVGAIGSIPELGIHTVDLSTSLELDARARLRFEVSTLADGVMRTAALLEPALASLARLSTPSVDTLFEFPSYIRSACEQYLLHFADFLRDLGVNTSVTLAEVASQVLFSVTPIDRYEALENIRIALDAYLHLPGAIILDDPEGASDRITAYKLRANLNHLQAQLDLARAQNEAMQTHLRTQNVLVELLRHRTLAPRLKGEHAQPDSESLSKYVSVTDVEKGGVKIHLASLLRDLKNLFRKTS